jgi:hypothetical protein
MNYLAAVASRSIATMPQFNDVRRYVRNDVHPSYPMVEILRPMHVGRQSTGKPVLSHFLTVERRGPDILAQVSLFGRLRYLIRLSRVPFAIETRIRSCHVFDLEKRTAHAIDRLPELD